MARKIGWLLLILMIRMSLGMLLGPGCVNGEILRLKGMANEILQKDDYYIIVVHNFGVKIDGWREIEEGEKVVVIGKCEASLLDRFLGRIWLIEGVKEEVVEGKQMQNWVETGLLKMRQAVVGVFRHELPSPEDMLVGGIVVGEKSGMTNEFYEALIKTGTIHIVVASGYNLMIVSEVLLYVLLYFLRRKWASIAAVGGVWLYALMVGLEPPILRAAIMASLLLWGKTVGRQVKSGWALVLAVWLMLMWRPTLLLSVGFQLSVAATVGLVWLEPKIRAMVKPWLGVSKVVARVEILPTLAASLMTLPLIWWHFGRISWWGPLVNMLILPLVPLVMGLGAIMGLVGLVFAPGARLIGWGVYAVAHLMVVIIELPFW